MKPRKIEIGTGSARLIDVNREESGKSEASEDRAA